MEKIEKFEQPQIKAEELLTVLNSIDWEDGFYFEYNGTEYLLIITSSEELKEAETEGRLEEYGGPAEYARSNLVDGYDIYLHDTIPASERNITLFHEIMESNLQFQGLSEPEAHEITMREQEKAFGKKE